MDVFTNNIEKIILDHFEKAKESIVIVVAWFTNPKLINKLIEVRRFKNIDIRILVDNNNVNRKYFYKAHASNLKSSGIIIEDAQSSRFNHNKFVIIDNEIFVTGSYNFSKKANTNLENIVIKKDKNIANFYFRNFKFFTEKNFVDENVLILFDNLEFANKIISTYYDFSLRLMNKVKDKIIIGTCFTHPNGLYDEISYEPGLIFNPKFNLHKELKSAIRKKKSGEYSFEFIDSELNQEFDLPIDKELIINFKAFEINNFNHQIHQEIAYDNKLEIDYEELGEDFIRTESAIRNYYTHKFEAIYSNEKLSNVVKSNIDLVKEDYIWLHNFAPFINDEIVDKIYEKIDVRYHETIF